MAETGDSWLGLRVLVVSPTPTHPQDHGNRKRIFEICGALKRRGAHVHFAHYAAEHDWREARPARHEAEMRACWDGYDLVAPSRALHAAAEGRDHAIDEWADPVLTAFVAWACRADRFDAVIVNYSWLSFCLDAVPAGIFRIVDTHDAFGRRRTMLESLGVAAEFFHTTPEEEAKGLARADLVWAIKEEERAYFSDELRLPNCLTVGHAEPERAAWPDRPRDGVLRAGFLGARNSVNRRNLELFLLAALPLFHHRMAGIKLVIGGGCAADFAALRHPNVEIAGRVDSPEAFYRGLDVVIAPIAASSGMKIKVAEAFAMGAPLVATAHATEGFATDAALHRLADFDAMARALVELAFEPKRLAALATQSRRVWQRTQTQVAGALDETRRQIAARARGTVCVIAPAAALHPGGLLAEHLEEVLAFLRRSHPVALYVTGAVPETLNAPAPGLRIFAAPGPVLPDGWTPVGLADLLANQGFERAYVMADCRADMRGGTGTLRRAWLRMDAVAIAGGDAAAMADFLRATVPTVLVSATAARLGDWDGRYGIAEAAAVPFRQTRAFGCFARPDGAEACILVLGAPRDPLVPALRAYAEGLQTRLVVLDPEREEWRTGLVQGDEALRALIAAARVAIDLGAPHPLTGVVGEAVRRAGIPLIRPQRGAGVGARAFAVPEGQPATLGRLLREIGLALADGAFAARQQEATRDQAGAEMGDGGWYFLWRDIARDPRKRDDVEVLLG